MKPYFYFPLHLAFIVLIAIPYVASSQDAKPLSDDDRKIEEMKQTESERSKHFKTTTVPDDQPVFRPLPEASLNQLERQRAFVAKLVADHFPGERITGTPKDFALLQKIVDSKILNKTQTWELQSLGIIFGDALIKQIPGLHWMEVTDSYGTDPALLYLDTTLQLNPLTMLSKRVEDGKLIDVADLVAALEEYVQKQATDVDKRK